MYEAEKTSRTDLKEVRFETGHFISLLAHGKLIAVLC